jgi:predicted RNA-binding protein with PUA-like domain
MNYWLVKTDPDTYSVQTFSEEKRTLWDGVHNHQAINYIKKMKPGDIVFVYESLSTKSILGLAKVDSEPFLNKEDPRFSWAAYLQFIKHLEPFSLKQAKLESNLKDFKLVTNSRLSVMPVEDEARNFLIKNYKLNNN